MPPSNWNILCGDVRDKLLLLDEKSVHCCVTSPPYFGLRDYGHAGQIGLEPTPEEYVSTMVGVFRLVRRALRDDGTLWLNSGDTFFGSGPNRQTGLADGGRADDYGDGCDTRTARHSTLKPKDLCMIPARVALALQADGWYIRSQIVWAKKACMPESVTDRPTSAWESIFLLTKSERYHYDADAVREPHARTWNATNGGNLGSGEHKRNGAMRQAERDYPMPNPSGANLRNVWHLSPEPWAAAHFATFPTEIPRRAIKAGTSEAGCCASCGAPWTRVVDRPHAGATTSPNGRPDRGMSCPSEKAHGSDTRGMPSYKGITKGFTPSCSCPSAPPVPCLVLDPFTGSGTTGAVAIELGRQFVGIELNPEYAAMAEKRIKRAGLGVGLDPGPLPLTIAPPNIDGQGSLF